MTKKVLSFILVEQNPSFCKRGWVYKQIKKEEKEQPHKWLAMPLMSKK